MQRVLCLGAHSDDIEIGCGGTMLRLAKECPDLHVRWEVFSAGAEREREARQSAAAFLQGAASAEVHTHEFRDAFFPSDIVAIKEIFETFKKFDPQLILTHHRGDLHQDHRVLSELTWNTFRHHTILEYEIPKYDGDLGHPNIFVLLEDTVCDRKIELLMSHFPSQAQRQWFDPATFRAMLRLRGIECAAATGWAEAFHVRKLTW